MAITLRQAQGQVPVSILAIDGELDASNYLDVIARAKEAYDAGARHLLIDLGDVPFMASSGLVALHSVALLYQGREPPDPSYGWAAIRSIDRELDGGAQGHVKLLSPQPRVERVLKMAMFERFFEIHADEETAIASF